MRYRHVVFDVDGTLIDSEYAATKAFQDVLLELTGRLYPPEELQFGFGIPGEDALRRLGLESSPAITARWAQITRKYLGELRLYPGIPQLLEALQAKSCRMGIVTSRTTREFEDEALPVLAPVAGYFETVVVADLTAEHKPQPEPLLKYMELAGAAPGETLFLGDTPDDSACAAGAGVDFAVAAWGSHGRVRAEYAPKEPGELLTCLD